MRNKLNFFIPLLLLMLFVYQTHAANMYWVGGASKNWNTGANWSTTSGGAGGAGVPGSGDIAFFDGAATSNHRCNVNATVNILGLNISGDTLSQGANTITIGSTGASCSGGVFIGGSSNITVSGAFTISGTTFTSTSATFSISANFTISSGSFAHNNGNLTMTATSTLTVSNTGGTTFYDLSFQGGIAYTITSTTTLTTAGTLTLATGTANAQLNSGTINAAGNISLSNSSATSGGGGTTTIIINGSGTQTLMGSTTLGAARICTVQITKSGSDTLKITNTITALSNWNYNSGIVSSGSSTIVFAMSKTISGSHTLNNVLFFGGASYTFTIAGGTILTIKGTMTVNGSNALTFNTGTINPRGDITITNTSTSTGGSASILIDSTANQTWTGSGTAGQGKLPNVTINKSSGTLTLASIISVTGGWTYIAGTVDATSNTSTVDFYGNLDLDGQGTSTTMSFYNVTTAGNTITLTGNLGVSNNLTINNSTTLSAGSNSITVGANWSDNGTWTYATSTVTFNGSGYNTIAKSSGTETFYNLTFNRTTKSQTLINPVTVNNVLTLTKGHVKTTNTNILELIDNATLSGGGIGAYVHGPVRKTGNDAFIFPVGDTTLTDSAAYHPLFMTAPSSTGDQFDATYFPVVQTYGTTRGSGVASLSTCEYWTFKRVTGSSTPTVSLNWNSNCDNSNYSEMREVIWNGSQWNDLGQASISISNSKTGKLTASSVTSFSVNPAPLTIGYDSINKSYSVLSKTLDGGVFYTDGYELYFGFNEEYKDGNGYLTYSITDMNTNLPVTLLGNTNNYGAVHYGINQFKIDLYDSSNNPMASGYYMLEVINEKNEKWYLRFKI